MSQIDDFIAPSTSRSQRSTIPLAAFGSTVVSNATRSFSTERMPVMMSSLVKSSAAIPSKHFLRWGWTRSGSFVSERIWNGSSFERKKRRANASRFVSR